MRSFPARALLVALLMTAFAGAESASAATVSIRDAAASEGATARVSVRLAKAQRTPVRVRWSTRNATAQAGTDYTARSGVVRFARRQRRKTIRIPLLQDTAPEAAETFAVVLKAATKRRRPRFADRRAVVTIADDDFAIPALTPAPSQPLPPLPPAPGAGSSPTGGGATGSGGSAPGGGGGDGGDGDGETPDPDPPTLAVSDVLVDEGTGTGETVATFTVARTGDPQPAVSVEYLTAEESAAADSDYEPQSGTLDFASGQNQKQVSVVVVRDAMDEDTETFELRLDNASGATIDDGIGVATITDDDPPPTVSINDPAPVLEGNTDEASGPITFTVTLSGPSGKTVTVDYATANSTGTSGSDYDGASGTLSFTPGDTSETVSVDVNGDTVDEPNEFFFVDLSSPQNATLTAVTADRRGIGTIQDDDPATFSINDVSQAEGDSGMTTFEFTVTRSTPTSSDTTVGYATANDTATAGSDYVATSGMVTIPAGQTQATASVTVNGDTAVEPNETFFVNLSGGNIADGQGVGTIQDDEPRFSIDDVALFEGDSGTTAFVFTVTLNKPSASTVTVNYATADYIATTADNDYEAASGMLTFSPGETSKTVSVTVNGDTVNEPVDGMAGDEIFFVNLSFASGATISDNQGAGTIRADD